MLIVTAAECYDVLVIVSAIRFGNAGADATAAFSVAADRYHVVIIIVIIITIVFRLDVIVFTIAAATVDDYVSVPYPRVGRRRLYEPVCGTRSSLLLL